MSEALRRPVLGPRREEYTKHYGKFVVNVYTLTLHRIVVYEMQGYIMPEHIDARVTVKFEKARWDAALTAILESHGLWYRYRPNGKLLRIATRNELDREAEQKLGK